MKRKNSISKNDIIRGLKNVIGDINGIVQRIVVLETILTRYIEMKKDDKKIVTYMDKKNKEQEEKIKARKENGKTKDSK
ncbi:hypothetical protein [uncultured Mediterranean phage uvMED]|nr:hypothetical protein [uncultured Mediterranean phage uvMED]